MQNKKVLFAIRFQRTIMNIPTKISMLILLLLYNFIAYSQHIGSTEKTNTQIIKEVKKGHAYLIDVRTPEEFAAGHLKYATNIDYKAATFSSLVKKLPKEKPVYLYCCSGNRSGKGLDSLTQFGFKYAYNIGGLEDLKKAGLPVE